MFHRFLYFSDNIVNHLVSFGLNSSGESFQTNAASCLQAPSQSHDYYLWTVRSISYHAKGIENSAHLYCIERSFSTYCKIVVTERKL